jgi:uncharacterized protein with PIN domain
MRLFCDEMLGATARWLRAAGYDTMLAEPGRTDPEILDQCRGDGRILVTRDRQLAQAAAPEVRTVLLIGDDPDRHAQALCEALGVDWTLAPFTRCLVDNARLEPAGANDLARMPVSSRALPGPFRTCPCCGRVYWPGSHVRRMIAQLERWRALGSGPDA